MWPSCDLQSGPGIGSIQYCGAMILGTSSTRSTSEGVIVEIRIVDSGGVAQLARSAPLKSSAVRVRRRALRTPCPRRRC